MESNNEFPKPAKRRNYWTTSTGILIVVLLPTLYLYYRYTVKNPSGDNYQSSPSPTQSLVLPKTYTNSKYPDFFIKYNDSWSLEAEELDDDNFGNGVTNTLIKLKKEETTLFFDISVGTSMGGELDCYSKTEIPYTLVSDELLRYVDSKYGNFYWQSSILKEPEEERFNQTLSAYTDAFECQKNNSCEVCTVLAHQTTTTNTMYPLPANLATEKSKNYRALVRLYVKQDSGNPELLNEADDIVEETLDLEL